MGNQELNCNINELKLSSVERRENCHLSGLYLNNDTESVSRLLTVPFN